MCVLLMQSGRTTSAMSSLSCDLQCQFTVIHKTSPVASWDSKDDVLLPPPHKVLWIWTYFFFHLLYSREVCDFGCRSCPFSHKWWCPLTKQWCNAVEYASRQTLTVHGDYEPCDTMTFL